MTIENFKLTEIIAMTKIIEREQKPAARTKKDAVARFADELQAGGWDASTFGDFSYERATEILNQDSRKAKAPAKKAPAKKPAKEAPAFEAPKLTILEQLGLVAAAQISMNYKTAEEEKADNATAFGVPELAKAIKKTQNQTKGIVGSLTKKGLLTEIETSQNVMALHFTELGIDTYHAIKNTPFKGSEKPKADAKKAPAKKPAGKKAPAAKVEGGPNERAAAKHSGVKFKTVGKTARKEGTVGHQAWTWLSENPGATAGQIAKAGNFMQHIDWDLRKTKTVEAIGVKLTAGK